MNVNAFVDFLVREGVIPADRKNSILEAASVSGDRVDTIILDMTLAGPSTLRSALGRFSKSRTVQTSDLAIASPEVTGLIPPRLARRFGVIPFKSEGKTLSVAALDPGDLLVQDELGLLTGSMITTFAALEIDIREALARHYGAAINPRIESLIRRLRHPKKASAPAGRPVEVETSPPAPPAPDPPVSSEPAEAVESPPKPADRHSIPSELEFSEEDLALFPSFAPNADSAEIPDFPSPAETQPIDVAAPPSLDVPPEDLEARLAWAADALQSAEIRDDLADVLLAFSRPHFQRTVLLALRKETIVGWRGEGEGVDASAVRAIAIPRNEPSVFSGLLQGTAFWLGPLPPMPRNQEIVMALGPPPPGGCLVIPIKVKGKIAAFLYGDCGADPLGAIPMAQFKRLLAKTDIAFQVYLLKGKIRVI